MSDANAYNTKAAKELEAGNLAAAIDNIRQAIALDPGSVTYRKNLAAILTLAGRHDEAEREYTSLIEDYPDDKEIKEQYRIARKKRHEI